MSDERLEPFESEPEKLPSVNLPPEKQAVLDRQVKRFGASNGDRVIADLLQDYSAEIVSAACDYHFADTKGTLDPRRLMGICKSMLNGQWKIPEKSSNESKSKPKNYGLHHGP